MEWIPLVAVVLSFGLPLAWNAYSQRRSKPLVTVHHWWVRVIDPQLLKLSYDVFVGTRRAVGGTEYEREWREDRVLVRIKNLQEGDMTTADAIDSFVEPAFKVARKSASVDTVLALRVSIHNTSRRYIVDPNSFELLVDVGVSPGNVLGWNRKESLGKWPRPEFASEHDDPDTVLPSVKPPGRLGISKAVRDEFVVCFQDDWPEREWEPDVRVEQANSTVRLRVKPWQPTSHQDQSRHLRIFSRAARWLAASYRPPGPAA